MASTLAVVFGSSPGGSGEPGGWPLKVRLAALRALRTLIQGIAAAFPAAGPGQAILGAGYWETFGYSCLAALITAVVSFLNNVADFLPTDPSQKPPTES